MKPSELRGKQPDELQKELEALLRAQFGLRMQLATQQLTNTSQLKKVRRDIARVRTIMNQKAKANDGIASGRHPGQESAQADRPRDEQQDAEDAGRAGRAPRA